MRALLFLIAAVFLVSSSTGAQADDEPAPRLKGVRRGAPFHAYWATAQGKEKSEYQVLLVTHGPVEDLAGHTEWSKLPLDNMAMSFKTFGRDSFWSDSFSCVQKFGAVDAAAKSVEFDGVTYTYEECPLERLVAMLDKPFGTRPLHRIEPPLFRAEQTAKAFRLLLGEQLAAEKK